MALQARTTGRSGNTVTYTVKAQTQGVYLFERAQQKRSPYKHDGTTQGYGNFLLKQWHKARYSAVIFHSVFLQKL
jgi:hypothetical protein